MDIEKAFLYDVYHASFLKIHTMQYWADLAIWEKFLAAHPHEFKGLIELGTYRGGMSIFLLLQCVQWGMSFYTFDKQRFPLETPVAQMIDLEAHFHEGDIFEERKPKLLELIGMDGLHPLLLYCDDGNKPREFATFVPHLRSGDYVAVHDWGLEFHPQHVKPVEHLIEPTFWEECETLNSLTRFWKRL